MSARIGAQRLLAIVLAGGRGKRLKELTERRAKPAMSAGKLKFIDFCLSNIVNSKIIDHSYVLTQYLGQGIMEHLAEFNTESRYWDKFIRALPAQQQLGEDWYLGNANAVYQNHWLIAEDPAEYVLILAADHIYKCDYGQILAVHIERGADLTVSGQFMASAQAANNFGVIELDASMNVLGFREKPQRPKKYPGREGESFVSQGIYIFNKKILLEVLAQDDADRMSKHDFGGDIIPRLISGQQRVCAYDYAHNTIPGEEHKTPYWRDVGTIDAYWEALIDQASIDPQLDLYNEQWPIRTVGDSRPMLKVISPHGGKGTSYDLQYLAAGGGVLTNVGPIRECVLGRGVRVDEEASLVQSILLDEVHVMAQARLTKTIVEEGIVVPLGCVIGEDVVADEERDIRITEGGVRLVHHRSRL